MKHFFAFSRIVAKITYFICIALTGIMTVAVIAGVFFRFVLNAPLAWSEELSRYLMIAITMLASSLAIRERRHVGLTFIIERLPFRYYLVLIGNLLTIFFLVVLTVEGYKLAIFEGPFQRSPGLRIEMTYVFSSLFIGAIVMIIQVLEVMVRDFLDFRDPQKEVSAPSASLTKEVENQ